MMPLTMAKKGEPNKIIKIGGKDETRRFLESLGFVVGGEVTVVSDIGGNMILNVKDSRVALGKDMARRIMIRGETNTTKSYFKMVSTTCQPAKARGRYT